MSCPRGVFYKKKKEPQPLVHPKIAELWQLFGRLQEQGQKIQQMITREFQEKGLLISPEKFIPWNDYRLTGKYDAICRINGEFVLYEIKGAGSTILEYAKNRAPEPYGEHRIQVIIYHYFLRKNFPGIKPRILYVGRKTNERLEIPIEYEETEALKILEEAKNLLDSIEKDELPPMPETISFNKFTGKFDISMKALTCKHHALCLNDEHWYEKAMQEAAKRNMES